jgi:predicted dehydrogenase
MMKMAIIGAGGIAQKMADTINGLEEVEAYAIAARDYDRAVAFAKQYGFTKAYGSYEEMVCDVNVDLVYIATPHSHHYQHAKLCLEHNKHVICEKPFMVNAKQAEELIKIAEAKGLLITEAIWTRYMPSRKMIDDVITSGVIGTPTSLTANLGYPLAHVGRMLTPELAGGALLDLGVYLLHFAGMAFGQEVDRIISAATMTEEGVDARESITLIYKDGKTAVMHSSMLAVLDRRAVIFGTKGYLEIQNLNNPEKLTVYNSSYEEVSVAYPPKQITGFEYQVLACKEAIENKKTECEAIPHAEILRIMKMMDEIRAQWEYEIPTI